MSAVYNVHCSMVTLITDSAQRPRENQNLRDRAHGTAFSRQSSEQQPVDQAFH